MDSIQTTSTEQPIPSETPITQSEVPAPLTTQTEEQKTSPDSTTLSQDPSKQEEHKISTDSKSDDKETFDIEQVGGKETYKDLVEADKLCDHKMWRRVLKEVKEVNNDFQSLRTYIGVVADMIGALHYLIYPADGAMADKPLCGRILIPKDYPNTPPVIHLLTQTNRYNVDVYRCYGEIASLGSMHSSMCFDILRSKNNGGVWQPEYTLAALISSLLQAIVSIKVAQEHGPAVNEFVSMEKLKSIHQSVEMTYSRFQAVMPTRKEIAHIEGVPIPTKHLQLPERITSLKNNQDLITKSDAIYLQVPEDKMKENVYSIGLDLSELQVNPSTVFSIILSNSTSDPVGKKSETILIRNGVTATAAKKKARGETNWYYHGKPMNESNLKLIVTIGYNQFCISYMDKDKKVIHGDRPVSFLTPAEIGNVSGMPFYLNILMKNKGGATITVKTFLPDCGYVHSVAFPTQKSQ